MFSNRRLQTESITISVTEQILKKLIHNVEEFLARQEKKAGLSGFRDVQSKLENYCVITAVRHGGQ